MGSVAMLIIYLQKSQDVKEERLLFKNNSPNRPETVMENCADLNVIDYTYFHGPLSITNPKSRKTYKDLRRTLSVESIASRTMKRSSMIFNWLTNPENKIMYQGRFIDSKIFRLHSAMENRNSYNIKEATQYFILQEEDTYARTSVRASIFEPIGRTCNLEPSRNSTSGMCILVPAMTKGIVSNAVVCSPLQINLEGEEVDNEPYQHTIDMPKFSVGNIVTMNEEDDLSAGSSELNLIGYRWCAVSKASNPKNHGKDRDSISLYKYSRNQQLKSRRINSDALFYTGARINCEQTKGVEMCGRNHLGYRFGDCLKRSFLETVETLAVTYEREFSINVEMNSLCSTKINEIFLNGELDLIQELAESGFDFNAKDNLGNCALHYAALRGSAKIVAVILENGGNVYVRNKYNQLPVEMASNIGVRMLLSGVTLFYRGQYSNEVENRLTSKQMSFEL